jgi:aconitate hydratase
MDITSFFQNLKNKLLQRGTGMATTVENFAVRDQLVINNKTYQFFNINKLGADRLPFVHKILLENLLRHLDTPHVESADVRALINSLHPTDDEHEISFMPARVLLQDFTGVPAIVDLAAMRDAMAQLNGDPKRINPLLPVELVIDHSVQVDVFNRADALKINGDMEFQRNEERYAFLKWGQKAFDNFKVVPPDTGICHQVNLEYLARVVFVNGDMLYPDTLVGTDSHTTMINGLGVLGWGVGGIEAEAAMLGQPMPMLIPDVVGFELKGQLPEAATATDLVLRVTEILRKKGVVGKFVEFYGPGLAALPLADRATIANMAPEYGATCGFFPVDDETLNYLRLTGRSVDQVNLVEAYCKTQGLFHDSTHESAHAHIKYSEYVHLDLSTVVPSLAGPKRPQDRIDLVNAQASLKQALEAGKAKPVPADAPLQHGAVVIAAITSCTNTSNPAVMLGAGLLAKRAIEKGLTTKTWVKTSLAPGSRVVTDYLEKAGVMTYLDQLGFGLVGYGCTTCIGNSGPLPPEVSQEIQQHDLHVCAVLSGNRNFEGRIHPEVRLNYLASPPLVVAYALAGTMDIDIYKQPLGHDHDGKPVFLRDIWPTQKEIHQLILQSVHAEMFRQRYAEVYEGDEHWAALKAPVGERYGWQDNSTYVKNPPYFTGMTMQHPPIKDVTDARVLVMLGDSVTTDHISPAGSIGRKTPAGEYLLEHGVQEADFNSYGARRGNHEVMIRGTFANIRLRNQLAPGTEGGWTKHLPDGEQMSIFAASERYIKDKVPLVILAGKEYGSGSSRDWAAKGPRLLGVVVVIAESYERIHRSNLVGMGILPLEYLADQNAAQLGLTGTEIFSVVGLRDGHVHEVKVLAKKEDGSVIEFYAAVRLDTPQEVIYYQHGGILPYMVRQLMV